MNQWQSLLERFLRHKCTGRENKIVYYALRDGLIDDEFNSALDAFLNEADTIAFIDGSEPVPNEVLKNIRIGMKNQYDESEERRFILPEWLKIAVAVVISISVSWIAFHMKTQNKTEPPQAMNTIRVPAGHFVNLTLADGTNIWLNARTTLQYPEKFTGNNREVILDGEGYFDVANNSSKPFLVHTKGYDVEALGTQFNVDAYSKEASFTGALFEGSVRITSVADTTQSVVLLPNTLARLRDGMLDVETITDFNYYRWREGLIVFKNMPFAELMSVFEKCYGIKIVMQNNRLNSYAPSGKFRQSDGIDYALRVLQRDIRFRFERNEENHTIYIK